MYEIFLKIILANICSKNICCREYSYAHKYLCLQFTCAAANLFLRS